MLVIATFSLKIVFFNMDLQDTDDEKYHKLCSYKLKVFQLFNRSLPIFELNNTSSSKSLPSKFLLLYLRHKYFIIGINS